MCVTSCASAYCDAMPKSTTPDENKRRVDRERVAAKRATLTPEERAALRRAHDKAYRATHREQRNVAQRERRIRAKRNSS